MCEFIKESDLDNIINKKNPPLSYYLSKERFLIEINMFLFDFKQKIDEQENLPYKITKAVDNLLELISDKQNEHLKKRIKTANKVIENIKGKLNNIENSHNLKI